MNASQFLAVVKTCNQSFLRRRYTGSHQHNAIGSCCYAVKVVQGLQVLYLPSCHHHIMMNMCYVVNIGKLPV